MGVPSLDPHARPAPQQPWLPAQLPLAASPHATARAVTGKRFDPKAPVTFPSATGSPTCTVIVDGVTTSTRSSTFALVRAMSSARLRAGTRRTHPHSNSRGCPAARLATRSTCCCFAEQSRSSAGTTDTCRRGCPLAPSPDSYKPKRKERYHTLRTLFPSHIFHVWHPLWKNEKQKDSACGVEHLPLAKADGHTTHCSPATGGRKETHRDPSNSHSSSRNHACNTHDTRTAADTKPKSKRSKTKATHILSESDGRPEKESGGEKQNRELHFLQTQHKEAAAAHK